ncbi:hypothetical protein BB561_004434 [Smittium simulii]|uniref:Uncharacterized protein n=1 Tax=Smittium simulii TaxID=133385 RepID=A0A2T9YGB1_9FUNG|nr:hypothetical protein BB561_004434 [Smittium simulii]
MSTNMKAVQTQEELLAHLQTKNISVLFFTAEWAEACNQVETMLVVLAEKYSKIEFLKLDADQFEEVVEGYEIEAVPTVLFVRGKEVIDRVEGVEPQKLTSLADSILLSSVSGSSSIFGTAEEARVSSASISQENKAALTKRIESLVAQQPVMVFIKGSPNQPRCGFSKRLVETLKRLNVSFGYFDILSDEDVRQELKVYSNWPTYPQLYSSGELVGGIDIVEEMINSDEFLDVIPETAKALSN